MHTQDCMSDEELVCGLEEHEHTQLCLVMESGTVSDEALYAYDRNTGYHTDLNNPLYLAVYTGTDFPGEPAWYSEAGYKFFGSSFSVTGGQYASRASSVLKSSILDVLTQGPTTNNVKVWGLYSSVGTENYFVDNSLILNRTNEEKIIRAVKSNNVNVDDYEIIWYVIKFQTDTYWHIDGLVVNKTTYNVNYYGNGNTSGGAPNGETGLHLDDVYTVLGNVGNLKKVVDGEEYTFTGWNTQADGSGTQYAPGDEIVITGNVSLYAQWEAPNKETLNSTPSSFQITGEKIWIDDNNSGGIRPGSVAVNLYANSVKIGTQAIGPENNWKYAFIIQLDAADFNADMITFTIG